MFVRVDELSLLDKTAAEAAVKEYQEAEPAARRLRDAASKSPEMAALRGAAETGVRDRGWWWGDYNNVFSAAQA